MNILTSVWIPVELANGEVARLAIKDIPGSGALRVAHPRADFSALITEMLVTIFQSLAAPADDRERLKRLSAPAEVDFSWIAENEKHFELFGEGSRFLQSPVPLGEESGAGALVYEAPGANTLKKNADFFVSRHQFARACPCCATAGLFLNQAHARQGGSGYFVTRRGGSALTALLEAPTLWETITLNLLNRSSYEQKYCFEDGEGFPWTHGTAAFTKSSLGPAEVGRHVALWWMPLALYLHVRDNPDALTCSLCGEASAQMVTAVSRTATKARPSTAFEHPLTVWFAPDPKKSAEGSIPLQVPSAGFFLDEWFALTLGVGQRSNSGPVLGALPAIAKLPRSRAASVKLWLAGKSMKINSLLFDYEERAPVICAETPESQEALVGVARTLSDEFATVLAKLRKALIDSLDGTLNRASSQVLADFSSFAHAKVREMLARIAAIPDFDAVDVLLSQEDFESFSQQLRSMAARLFEQALELSHLEQEVLRKVLEHQSSFHKSLFAKASAKKAKSATNSTKAVA